MKGQLLVAQLPVLLEQRAAHHRFRRQAVSSGLPDPVPAQIAGRQTQQRTVFVEPLRDGFQLAADFVLRENFKYSCLDDAFLTHCRVPTVADLLQNQWLVSKPYLKPLPLAPQKIAIQKDFSVA